MKEASEKSINDLKGRNVCVALMKWHFIGDKERRVVKLGRIH